MSGGASGSSSVTSPIGIPSASVELREGLEPSATVEKVAFVYGRINSRGKLIEEKFKPENKAKINRVVDHITDDLRKDFPSCVLLSIDFVNKIAEIFVNGSKEKKSFALSDMNERLLEDVFKEHKVNTTSKFSSKDAKYASGLMAISAPYPFIQSLSINPREKKDGIGKLEKFKNFFKTSPKEKAIKQNSQLLGLFKSGRGISGYSFESKIMKVIYDYIDSFRKVIDDEIKSVKEEKEQAAQDAANEDKARIRLCEERLTKLNNLKNTLAEVDYFALRVLVVSMYSIIISRKSISSSNQAQIITNNLSKFFNSSKASFIHPYDVEKEATKNYISNISGCVLNSRVEMCEFLIKNKSLGGISSHPLEGMLMKNFTISTNSDDVRASAIKTPNALMQELLLK